HLEAECFQAPFVLEGGSIHVDGAGTLITTEQCLLNPNRNPLFSRGEIEEHLMQFLGIRKVIWLGEGLEDDETDGHVDNVAAFVRPGVIVATMPADPADPNHRIMQDNIARLRGSRDAAGREIEVVELPQPARRENPNGTRQALSYVNFYIANGGIVMPGFEDPEDAKARAVLDKLFPDRQVVQVSGSDIVVGGGCIHCITQQQPAGDPLG
ncbi:MAG: agmatine deiminase family protein, partial [Minwuiales bacterium]|nr:agmatine deiminase family protein [Minwuiales bacterium]